jgi:hypothetical protein
LLQVTYRVRAWRTALMAGGAADPQRQTPGSELLVTLLRDLSGHGLERMFRLLGLLHPSEDLYRVYKALISGKRKGHDDAVELLEHLLPPADRTALLTLVNGSSDTEQRAVGVAAGFIPAEEPTYTSVLAELLDGPMDSVRALAAYHVGELGLTELSAALSEVAVSPTSYAADVVTRAQALFAKARDAAGAVIHAS